MRKNVDVAGEHQSGGNAGCERALRLRVSVGGGL